MYNPMLFVHWKQVRLLLIPFVVAAFGLPLLAVQGFGWEGTGVDTSFESYRLWASYQVWLEYFPMLAASVGALVALTAWNWDHRFGHVYALSLPVARWEYVMLKMGAGAALLLIPVGALWIGAQLASASVEIPEGLRAYPNQLAFRFLLASLISYSLFFAMGASTIRTTIWVVSSIFVFIVGGNLIGAALAYWIPSLEGANLVSAAVGWFVRAGGPFAVFTGSWTLIDV
jgi:hypothetical protein